MHQDAEKKHTAVLSGKRRVDIPLIALNLILVAAVAVLLFFSNTKSLKSAEIAAMSENGFLITEWRLLQEMKQRTDRLLSEKDREIAELRGQYEDLLARDSSSEMLDVLLEKIQQAEEEREKILSVRFEASGSDPEEAGAVLGSAGSGGDSAFSTDPGTEAFPGSPESPVVELLRRRILELEGDLADDGKDMEALADEISSLQASLGAMRNEDTHSAGESDQAIAVTEEILAMLRFNRDSLMDSEPVLGLADIKTRSLMRAIVRTPAIRSEYPELVDSLDRYFEIYGSAKKLEGMREAYEEAIGSIETFRIQSGTTD